MTEDEEWNLLEQKIVNKSKWSNLSDQEIMDTFKEFGVQVKGIVWLQVARAIENKLKVKNL